jgi:hypothetical protein
MTIQSEEEDYFENELYNQFPSGSEQGYGTGEGFHTFLKLNDASLFAAGERENNHALDQFLKTSEEDKLSIYFVAWKSSTRESEWALHKPHLTMNREAALKRPEAVGLDQTDISGAVDNYPGADEARISTFVINHDVTLARLKQSVIVMEDGKQAGQMIYKHPPSSEEPA